MKTEEFLNKIKYAVLSVDDKAEVILFGSRARGDSNKDSDWDILVLTDKLADAVLQNSIRDKVYHIELEYVVPVSTIIRSKKDWENIAITPFYKNILREGKPI